MPRHAKDADALRYYDKVLELRPGHAGFHRDGLVDFVEGHNALHVAAHVERYTAFHRLHPAGDGRAGAMDVNRNQVFVAIIDYLLNFFSCTRREH